MRTKNFQTSLVLLKTDTVLNANMWNVIKKFEQKKLKIVWIKMMWLDEKILRQHYFHVVDKPFFSWIVKYMTQSPILALAIYWNNWVEIVRKLTWTTNPAEAESWTIRWDFWHDFNTTVIHSSDSLENAERELKIFFKNNEIFEYEKNTCRNLEE